MIPTSIAIALTKVAWLILANILRRSIFEEIWNCKIYHQCNWGVIIGQSTVMLMTQWGPYDIYVWQNDNSHHQTRKVYSWSAWHLTLLLLLWQFQLQATEVRFPTIDNTSRWSKMATKILKTHKRVWTTQARRNTPTPIMEVQLLNYSSLHYSFPKENELYLLFTTLTWSL